MGSLTPVINDLATRRQERSTGRALARLEDRATMKLAQIEQAAEVQAGRVTAVSYVGKRAMQEVALVSQMEQQLATVVPMATSRLQAIGDIVALEAAGVVADTAWRIG